MAQLSIRLDDELARQVKAHAATQGRSVNGLVVSVLTAVVNPDLEDSESERTRARLERAGLLVPSRGRPRGTPPDRRRVADARKSAGAGTALSQLVSDGRG